MAALSQRRPLLAFIEKACLAGARLHKACAVLGLAAHTVQRWLQPTAAAGDRRVRDQRTTHVPANKFTDAERQAAMDTLSSNAFKGIRGQRVHAVKAASPDRSADAPPA